MSSTFENGKSDSVEYYYIAFEYGFDETIVKLRNMHYRLYINENKEISIGHQQRVN